MMPVTNTLPVKLFPMPVSPTITTCGFGIFLSSDQGLKNTGTAARARAGEPQEHAGGRADHSGAAVQERGEHIRRQVDQQVQLSLWRADRKRALPGRLLSASGCAHLELLLPQVREQVVGALLQALATARVDADGHLHREDLHASARKSMNHPAHLLGLDVLAGFGDAQRFLVGQAPAFQFDQLQLQLFDHQVRVDRGEGAGNHHGESEFGEVSDPPAQELVPVAGDVEVALVARLAAHFDFQDVGQDIDPGGGHQVGQAHHSGLEASLLMPARVHERAVQAPNTLLVSALASFGSGLAPLDSCLRLCLGLLCYLDALDEMPLNGEPVRELASEGSPTRSGSNDGISAPRARQEANCLRRSASSSSHARTSSCCNIFFTTEMRMRSWSSTCSRETSTRFGRESIFQRNESKPPGADPTACRAASSRAEAETTTKCRVMVQ